MIELRGARWSAASRCPRQAAYGLLGAFGEALPPRVQGLYDRGNDVEDAWFRRLPARDDLVHRQYPVKWGMGWEAHVDGYFEGSNEMVEVKSTVSPQHLPGSSVTWNGVETTSAVLQVAGAARFDGHDAAPRVVAVNPIDYSECEYPITLTDDLAGLADETALLVLRAAEKAEMPPRACKRPTEGLSRFCPYMNTCFADWEEPEPIQLDGSVARLALELEAIEDAYRQGGSDQKILKEQRDEAREQMRNVLPGPGDFSVAGVHIRLSTVKGRETFSLKDAIAAGAISKEEAEPFIRRGEESERWTVAREEGS